MVDKKMAYLTAICKIGVHHNAILGYDDFHDLWLFIQNHYAMCTLHECAAALSLSVNYPFDCRCLAEDFIILEKK